MKYEAELARLRHLPWRAFYMDYARLKHLIYEQESGEVSSNEAFLTEFHRQLEKVDQFYAEQERLLAWPLQPDAPKASREALGQLLEVDIPRLLEYARLNATGFRKVAKKYDRRANRRSSKPPQDAEGGAEADASSLEADFTGNIVLLTIVGQAEARLGNLQDRFLRLAGDDRGDANEPLLMVSHAASVGGGCRERMKTRAGMEVVAMLEKHKDKRSTQVLDLTNEIARQPSSYVEGRTLRKKPGACWSSFRGALATARDATKGSESLVVGALVVAVLCVWACSAGWGSPKLTTASFISIFVLYVALHLLVSQWPADAVLLGATLALRAVKVLDDPDAWGGFSNEVVLSVATLGVVASGVQRTGAAAKVFNGILGRPTSVAEAMLRLFLPTIFLNACVNNTATMGILLPVTDEWTHDLGMHRGLFLMPLSYLILISGCITIFGTSSNLIMQGLLIDSKLPPFNNFEIAPVALPATLAALAYFVVVTPRLFPHFASAARVAELQEPRGPNGGAACAPGASTEGAQPRRRRRFVAALQVRAPSGADFGASKLASLVDSQDVYLVERLGRDLLPPDPLAADQAAGTWDMRLQNFDVMHIYTTAETLVNVWQLPTDEGFSLLSLEQSFHVARGSGRELVEVMIDTFCPLQGKDLARLESSSSYADVRILATRPGSLEHANYDSVAGRAAAAREHLGKYRGIGAGTGYRLKSGDGLLLDCPPGWATAQSGNPEFTAVRKLSSGAGEDDDKDEKNVEAYSPAQVWFSGSVFVGMILSVSTDTLPLLQAALLAAFSLSISGCVPPKAVYQAVNLRTLVSIVGAFGLGKALGNTGVAAVLSGGLVSALGPLGAVALHAALFLATVGLGVVFHATAVVILMFPVAVSAAQSMGMPLHQLLCTVMMGAGCQMLSPVSYQTNMMVYAYNDYSFQGLPRLAPLSPGLSSPWCRGCGRHWCGVHPSLHPAHRLSALAHRRFSAEGRGLEVIGVDLWPAGADIAYYSCWRAVR